MKGLLVEDESVIRNGIRKHIDWKMYGIEEVYTAVNADEAFIICKTVIPDIIVSDICMPGMNGIELCRKLRGTMPELEIIFVTGYEDKEYLKAAIELGVVGYVEKPIRINALKEKIAEAVRRVNTTKKKQAACLYSFLQDSSADLIYTDGWNRFCAGVIHFRKDTKIDDIKKQLFDKVQPELEKEGILFQIEKIEGNTIVMLLGIQETDGFTKILEKKAISCLCDVLKTCKKDWFLSLGCIVKEKSDITKSYLRAREMGQMIAFEGWNCCVYDWGCKFKNKKEMIDKSIAYQFRDAVSCKNEKKINKILDELFLELKNKYVVCSEDVKYLFYSMENTINRAKKELCFLNKEMSLQEGHFLEYAETYAEIYIYFRKSLSEIFGEVSEQSNPCLINKIWCYIEENYAQKDFSIQQIADYLYLTPTYLSSFFKRNTGKTIGNYLLDIRVEKAKSLLRDPQLKSYHVAQMVGYEDANYFAKVFKKKTGMTPSDYKKSLELK